MKTKLLLCAFVCCLQANATGWYLCSAGSNADGTTWATAWTTLTTAFTHAAAGDTIYVCGGPNHVHAETYAGVDAFTSLGTAAAPINVICSNDGAGPPTSTQTGCGVTTTGTGGTIQFAGYAYVYGVNFNAGTGAGSSSIYFYNNTINWGLKFSSCNFSLLNTATSSKIFIGNATASTGYTEWDNVKLKFSSTSQTIAAGQNRFVWRNTALAIDTGGSIPTVLFSPVAYDLGIYEIAGVDFSAMGSGKSLVALGALTSQRYYFRNCRMGASSTLTSGTIIGPQGPQVWADNLDSGNTNYTFDHEEYAGSIKQSTSIYRTGGASDGVTPLSYQMISTANSTFYFPLESVPISRWNGTSGSSKTATVEIVSDTSGGMTNQQIFFDAECLTTSGFPLSTYTTSRSSDILQSPVTITSSAASWIGTGGMANPTPQKMSVTFTPQMYGSCRIVVKLAQPTKTVYVDPLVTIQ
jgi:hypothetical protein